MAKAVIVRTNTASERGCLFNVATGDITQYRDGDGNLGDVYTTVMTLIDLGILSRDDFVLFNGVEELLLYFQSAFE